MEDSQGKTGKQIIEGFNKDVLRELYVQEDLVADYKILRARLIDPDINHRDFASLLKLLWDYTIEKPKTTSEVKVETDISKYTDDQLDEIINKFTNDKSKTSEVSSNQEATTN